MRMASAVTPAGAVPVVIGVDGDALEADAPDLFGAIAQSGGLQHLRAGQLGGTLGPVDLLRLGIPMPRPGKVIGIGLNFSAHARDLDAVRPPMPTVFFKQQHTLIGPGDPIDLPWQSMKVTGEAELGLVIGRDARSVSVDDAMDHVGGFCCVLDQTAEDLLRTDSRLLTLAKNFPGFFSFGPEIVSLDELVRVAGSLEQVEIATCRNGEAVAVNSVSNMLSSPAELVSFLSHVMPLQAGDVISTGTPGAAVLTDGDRLECRISGLRSLVNPVRLGASRPVHKID